MKNRNQAKGIVAVLFLFLSTMATAQTYPVQETRFLNPLHALISTDASKYIDTVTDAGTTYIQTADEFREGAATTTITVIVTKISGTVGGTISLQGSLDGSNFKALNTAETQTALATITATDASNVYHWRLNGSPFKSYRVSWTGAGTMAASFSARLLKH